MAFSLCFKQLEKVKFFHSNPILGYEMVLNESENVHAKFNRICDFCNLL